MVTTPATTTSPGGGALSSLRHRDFALFWTAALISNSGTWMQAITVPYVLYDMTNSRTWLGFSAAASFVPGLLMGPIAGTLAGFHRIDRWAGLLLVPYLAWVSFAGLLNFVIWRLN